MALKPTAARALSFEDRLDCWLLEECSPPAAWTVEDYFVHVITPCFFQTFLRYPCFLHHQAPRWLLVPCTSAFQSVLTLTDERGGLGQRGTSYQHACQRQHLSVVLLCRSVQGVRKSLTEGGSLCARLLCHTSLPVCYLLSLRRGWCGWGWELGAFPAVHICG